MHSRALVYKTETSPGGISSSQQASRNRKSVYLSVLTAWTPGQGLEPVSVGIFRALGVCAGSQGSKRNLPSGTVCVALAETLALASGSQRRR